jgi:Zn-dependent protease/CBS domain-containing protein
MPQIAAAPTIDPLGGGQHLASMSTQTERFPRAVSEAHAPARSNGTPQPTSRNFGTGFRLGRIAGVDVHVDWSLLVVFLLITFNLGVGLLPATHPHWSDTLRWTVAVLAALLFFASVLAHELAHAIVGRRQGVPVEGITLFIFGGVARLKGEPPTARAELVMTIVGPLTSLVIGVFATLAGSFMLGDEAVALTPEAAFRTAGPLPTLLLWLGPINIILGLFNLVPGFPLDGGRVLRAILWKATDNLEMATRWATQITRIIAGLFVATGVMMIFGVSVPFFGTGPLSGLWLILIGWFMSSAARMSYQQVLVRTVLSDVPVAQLMRPDVPVVPPDLTVDEFVDDYLMATDQRSFPVIDDGKFVGVVTLTDVRKLRRADWPSRTVASIMTPVDISRVLAPDENAAEASRRMLEADIDQLPVVENGHLRGVVRRTDVLKWFELQVAG